MDLDQKDNLNLVQDCNSGKEARDNMDQTLKCYLKTFYIITPCQVFFISVSTTW